MHEPTVVSCFRPACIARTVAIILHGHWAIHDPPSTFPFFAIHRVRLVITISCKGQMSCSVSFRVRSSSRSSPPTSTGRVYRGGGDSDIYVVLSKPPTVESRCGPKRGFGETPGELLTISKPNPYPQSMKPPGRKGFTKPNL